MRKLRLAVVAACILTLTMSGAVWAQMGLGRKGGKGRLYNPQTVETIKGQVVSVKTTKFRRWQGVHLIVKTEKGNVDVSLGPKKYIDQQKMTFAPNDKVEISGSKVTLRGKPTIIAGVVKKGDQILTLRDTNGVPAWAGQGRRRQ